jgi:tetratricopeptide (TPR) repeat protein
MKHVGWGVGSALIACASLAQAGDAEASAREHYRAAVAHFDAGRYLEAQAGFAAGYEISHKPGFLWNMAECARSLKNSERALELYKRYLKEAPPGAQRRGEAEQHVRELEAAALAHQPAPLVPIVPVPTPGEGPASPPGPYAQPAPTAPAGAFAVAPTTDTQTSTPITKRWWFWAGAGALLVGAATTAAIVAGGGKDSATPTPSAGGYAVDWRAR